MAALVLKHIEIPGVPSVEDVVLAREQHDARSLAPHQGAALLRAVAGVRSRRRPGVSVGQVLVDGRDVDHEAAHERRIGYVPAGGGLLPHLTVGENIRRGAGRDELATRAAEDRARELAHRLDLTAALTLLPHELLAYEEHLRVALARAAMQEPVVRVVHLAPSLAPAGRTGTRALRAGPQQPAPGAAAAHADSFDALTAADLARLLDAARPEGERRPATLIVTHRADICAAFRRDAGAGAGAGTVVAARVGPPGPVDDG